LHISELADHKVDSPEEVVKVGDEVEVKVLRVDTADRKIGLSRKRLTETQEEAATKTEKARPQRELRGGTGSGSAALFALPAGPAAEGGSEGIPSPASSAAEEGPRPEREEAGA
jgi:small subunit ribosomal protein S1